MRKHESATTQPTENDIRTFLIAEAFRFVERVISTPGIRRVALLGSLTTEKNDPKDADFLLTVDDDADLSAIATAARRLKGATQTKNKGADIFLANPEGRYIGRICGWRECVTGFHASCRASHCGKRHFLNDDLTVVTLDKQLVQEPPIEVWPTVVCRIVVPSDLALHLARYHRM